MSNSYKILSTTDYSAFKRIKGNRTVRPAHVKKLKLAIERDPESIKYSPILVNEDMEIVDGQHRFGAISSLGLSIYYVKVKGLRLDNVQQLNSVAKQWQPIDYAKAFAELGNQNYRYYLQVRESDLSINHDSLMKYLSLDNPNTGVAFTEGRFKVQDFKRSVELLTQLYGIGAYYKRYNLRSFALAYLKFATEDQYNHKRMIKQLENYSHLIEDYAKEQDYFKALNRVYNFGKSEKNKVYFGNPEYLSQ